MAIENVQWASGDQIILTKQTGMTADITNDADDIHQQYLGLQKAANTFVRYVRVDKLSTLSDTITTGDTDFGDNGTDDIFQKIVTKSIVWEDGEASASVFDNTDYLPFAQILNLTTTVTSGSYRTSFISMIDNLSAGGCDVEIHHFAQDAAGALDIDIDYDLAIWGIKFGV